MNYANGVEDQFVGSPVRHAELEAIAVAGEIAFAKWQGIYPNLGTILVPDAPDYVINGIKIDVKARDRSEGDLIVPIHKREDSASVYVLPTLTGSLDRGTFEVTGWTTAKVVFSQQYLKDLGRGMSRVVPRSRLYPAETLSASLDAMSKFDAIRDYFKSLSFVGESS